MRRLLPFGFCLFLTFTFLLPTASTQQTAQNVLPDPASFVPAGPNCQRKVRVSPWVGTPSVNWPTTLECMLTIHTCTGPKTIRSAERKGGTGVCDDYWKVHDALATMEICCDPGSPGETPSPEPTPAEKPPDTKCPPSTPWFGSSNCKSSPKDPLITVSGGTATLYVCGQPVFYHVQKELHDPLFAEAYRAALRDHVESRLQGRICCDAFEEAVKTGKPCNPKEDVDCDGILNRDDLVQDAKNLPDINAFTRPEDASVDFYPSDYFEARRLPETLECACKWQLVKGELRCSRDGKEQHSYVATWRCPSTKQEVVIVNYAPPTTPCEK